MNAIKIAIKEIKISFRDKKNLAIMVLFPMLLMTVLGAAFGGVFKTSRNIPQMKILYMDKGSEITKDVFSKFKDVTKDDIVFVENNNFEEGKLKMSNSEYAAYLIIREDKIEICKNEKDNFNANLVQSILETVVSRYNTIISIAAVNPQSLKEIKNDFSKEYTEIVSLENKRTPSAKDFYSITMLTLIIMYSAIGGSETIGHERARKTSQRILFSPVKRYEYLLGKILGNCVATLFQIIPVIFYSKYILKAYWGNHMGTIMLIITSLIFMAISLGIGLAYVFNSDIIASKVLNLTIPLFVFLGGGYFTVDVINNNLFQMITGLSPIKWTNKAMFNVIYSNDFSLVGKSIFVNILFGFILVIISSLHFKKEAAV